VSVVCHFDKINAVHYNVYCMRDERCTNVSREIFGRDVFEVTLFPLHEQLVAGDILLNESYCLLGL